MASPRYTLNINLDDENDNKPSAPLTKKQKLENFWFYHRWHILIALIVLGFVVFFIVDTTSVVKHDIKIALLSDKYIHEEAIFVLEDKLAEHFTDFNGDGKVAVNISQYSIVDDEAANSTANSNSTDSQQQNMPTLINPYENLTSTVGLSANLQTGESIIFLTDDVEYYQKELSIFEYNDGTTPFENESINYENMGVSYMDSQLLTQLELGEITDYNGTTHTVEDYFTDFYIVKRNLNGTPLEDDKKVVEYYDYCNNIFEMLTK